MDTSSGVGRDASAFFIIGYNKFGAEEVASYYDRFIKQDEFAQLLVEVVNTYFEGKVFIMPDANYGMACTNALIRAYSKELLYVQDNTLEENTFIRKAPKEFGLRVTTANKELIANSFRSAIQDGTIILHSNDMYNSIMNYTNEIHMERRGFTKDNLISTGGRHFDLLNSARYAYFGLETRMQTGKKKVPKFNAPISTTEYLRDFY